MNTGTPSVMSQPSKERVGVVGLGYVGLPMALAMSKVYETIGFDIDASRVAELREGYDVSREVASTDLASASLTFTTNATALETCTFIIVAVPTPLDASQQPVLTSLLGATELLAAHLGRGAVVVYESTVYPGLTESICGPLLERVSGMQLGRDIHLAYSPERINPGDRAHGFERVKKVVAAQDEVTLERVATVYSAVVEAGVYRATSIMVAEAAKVVENTQRDVNIALMNEFSVVFERLGIRTADVLAAARSKWNFMAFEPGLVGGQCVGVAPMYLVAKAAMYGYQPDVITASRRTNEAMAQFVAQKILQLMQERGLKTSEARVGVLGVTFKENVADVRNSGVPKMLAVLRDAGVRALVHDPVADAQSVYQACGLKACDFDSLTELDVLVYAVRHRFYAGRDLTACLVRGGVFVDIKSEYEPTTVERKGLLYWSL